MNKRSMNSEADILLNEYSKRKKLLEQERHKYTTVQLRLTNVAAQIKDLEKKGSLTGIDESKLAILRASIIELKDALRNISEQMRRIEGRL